MSGFKKFTFDEALQNVLAMYEVKGTKQKAEKITGKTFDVESTEDLDVLSVTSTKSTSTVVETSIYLDSNGDDFFTEAFDLDVLKTVSVKNAEKHKFFGVDGQLYGDDLAGETVTTVQELGKKGWKIDSIDLDESIQTISLDDQTYVLKTETSLNGDIEFDLFRDGDADGLWTKVAEGEASAEYLSVQGGLDIILLGIVDGGLLAAADSIIG